jgi:acyl-CoA dehydrogenase
VFVPDSAILGKLGHGLPIAQTFVHENRLRQAASSLGAAEYCIEESIKYARKRKPFGKELSTNQAIQFPIVELATQAEMLKLLILKTATEMDGMTQKEIERDLGDKVSMCNVSHFMIRCGIFRRLTSGSIGATDCVHKLLIERFKFTVSLAGENAKL